MRNKARGRPAKYHIHTVRMSKGTKLRLKQLSQSMGMKQGKVLEIALQRLYDADTVEL